MLTTLVFAILLITFGTIVGVSMMSHRVMAANDLSIVQKGSQLNRCEQSDQGGTPICSLSFSQAASLSATITSIIVPPSTFEENFDQENKAIVTQVVEQQNKCTQSGIGESLEICSGEADQTFGSSQTDFASGSGIFDQDNNIRADQIIDQQNRCDQSIISQSSEGDSASCNNVASMEVNSIAQANTATGDGSFDQDNKADVAQAIKQQNRCDETEIDSVVSCSNDAFISDFISQTNTASGSGISNQANNANVADKVDQLNRCDQSGASNSECSNALRVGSGISQTNTASGSGNSNQANNANVADKVDQLNRCDQSDSDNAFCSNVASSFEIVGSDFLLPITQTNDASGDGSFEQGNDLNLDRTRDQLNQCDQPGSAELSSVSCENEALFVGFISQANTATGDGSFDQDNKANIVQTIEQQNQCDQSNGNAADCSNVGVAGSSFLGNRPIISQANTATGDGSFDQDNKANIVQTIEQQNQCDQSGAFLAFCSNAGYHIVLPFQSNDATGDGTFEQTNNMEIDQTIDQQNQCDQSGAFLAFCSNGPSQNISPPILQSNTATGDGDFKQANDFNVNEAINERNRCDQSGALVLASCNNNSLHSSHIFQINTATGDGSFEQANNIDADRAINERNLCDESGASFVDCSNLGFSTNTVSQTNTATGDGTFDQDNVETLAQTINDQNECNQLGASGATCSNGGLNFDSDMTQTNTATGDGSFEQSNKAEVNQKAEQINQCDQSSAQAALCDNFAINSIESISQTNDASGEGSFNQDNKAKVIQTIDQQNQCDQSGANSAICSNSAVADAFVPQSNTAFGDGNFDQSNTAKIVQIADQQNSCDQTGADTASCSNDVANTMNSFIPNTQTNFASGNDDSTFNQDNNAKVVQVVDQQNSCDQTGSAASLPASCSNSNSFFAPNDLNGISQSNAAFGDGSSFDQDNNAKSVQILDQQNNCDQTGTTFFARCTNSASNEDLKPQSNTAFGDGSSFDQNNNADVLQTIDQQNKCDESGASGAECVNDGEFNSDFVSQSNAAFGDGSSFDQNNNAKVTQTLDQQNNCDQSGAGPFALCTHTAFNANQFGFFGEPGQSNTASGDGSSFDQNNDADVAQSIDQQNNCDQSEATGAGCINGSVNFDFILQGNQASGNDGSFNQDNNLKLVQTIGEQNTCDQTEASGAACNFDGANNAFMRQTNAASGNDADFNQGNNANILQTVDQQNKCDQSGAANIATCFDSANNFGNLFQASTASGNDGSFNQDNQANMLQTVDQQNNCDQSLSSCGNVASNNGGIFQASTASGNDGSFNQDNQANMLQTVDQQNNCDQSGGGGGAGSNAQCANGASNLGSVSQTNTATGDGSSFDQANNANVLQTVDQQNNCDQSGGGGGAGSNAQCANGASNLGSVSQTDTATGDGSSFDQANNANVLQTVDQQNKCDQSEASSSVCANQASNAIGGVSQTNTATVDGDSSYNQANDAQIAQTTQQQNKCGDFGFGTDNVCQNSAISTVGLVSQTGGQSLDVNQNTDQNNHCNIDSACSNTATEDIEGINSGTVNQDVTQDNNCLFESSCSNTASATVADDGGTNNGNANTDQKIDQSNLCMFNSNCVNDASATGTDSSSNTQSNMCFFDSNCENTGVNDNTICIAGSNCSNSGTDSRLIGVAADDCSASTSGTTVCVGSLRVNGGGDGVSGFDAAGSAPTTSTALTGLLQPVTSSATPTAATTAATTITTTAGATATAPTTTTTTTPATTSSTNTDSLQNTAVSSDSASGLVSQQQQQQQQEEHQQPQVEQSELQQTPLSTTTKITSTTDNNVNTNNENNNNDDSKLTTAVNDNTALTSSSTTSTSTSSSSSSSSSSDSSSDGRSSNQALASDKSNDGVSTSTAATTTGAQGAATNGDVKSNDKQKQEQGQQQVVTSSDTKTSEGDSNTANSGSSKVDNSNSDSNSGVNGSTNDNAVSKKVHDDSGSTNKKATASTDHGSNTSTESKKLKVHDDSGSTNKKATASIDHGSNTNTESKKLKEDVKKDDTSTKKGGDNRSNRGGSEKHQKSDRTNKHDSIKEEKNDS